MANEFTDTNVTGTLRVNGVDVTTGITTGEHLARALTGMLGIEDDATCVIGTSTRLDVTAQTSPNLTVKISKGAALVAGVLTSSDAVASLSGFAAPSANPRIDIVQLSTGGVISRKAGTENVSPSAPSVDSGNIKLAEVYNRVGQTSIKNTDDSSNGYITNTENHR